MPRRVAILWQLSSFTGWGVYGLNLALNWAGDAEVEAVCAVPINPREIALDLLRSRVLAPFAERSQRYQADLQRHAGGRLDAGMPVLVSLGNAMAAPLAGHNVTLGGKPPIGVAFFETALAPDAVERANNYPLIVTGSTWNEGILRAHGVDRVRTVLQGVDSAHFHPAPRLGLLSDKFTIFSGGKAEVRKGQDIVLAAFKAFSERHPDAVLVTAWHCHWLSVARTLDQAGIAKPVVLNRQGQLDPAGWAAANGIPADRFIDLGAVPNIFLPAMLREMDVAVFPNRAEGGTNLVAMECMACGLPVILSRNTGHLDLIKADNCYPLDDQRQRPGAWSGIDGVPGWGESQVGEVVERLEQIHADRAEAARRGARAAQDLSRLTWSATAKQMKDIIVELA